MIHVPAETHSNKDQAGCKKVELFKKFEIIYEPFLNEYKENNKWKSL